MNMPYQVALSEVITQIADVSRVYVRMVLTKGDSGRLGVRSLLIDVFPQVWLDNPDSILADWLSTPYRYEYDRAGAVLLSEFVDSTQMRDWLRGGECRLEGFDTRPGFGTRILNFDVPEMHAEITAQSHYSYKADGFIVMPWPHTVYSFRRKDQTNNYRSIDFEPLVAPDAEYFANLAEARAEVIHGVSDPAHVSRYEDGVIVRVVHAAAWLNQVRIGQNKLAAIVHGLKVVGCQIVLSGSHEVRQRKDVRKVGAVFLPIPRDLPPRLIIALTRGGEELDRAVYTSGMHTTTLYEPSSRQVVVERDDTIEESTPRATVPDIAPNPVVDQQNEHTSGLGTLNEAATNDSTSGIPPKVFISYSHDTAQHARRVLALADLLRRDGIDCSIDAYEEAPAQGWPQWMEDQIEWAEFVLVVCTQTYAKRFRGKDVPDKGLGATWEGAILTQQLYNQAAKNKTIIPVVFSPEEVAHIPTVLQGVTNYNPSEGPQYTKLYRRLTNQPLIVKPPLGIIKRLPPRDDDGAE